MKTAAKASTEATAKAAAGMGVVWEMVRRREAGRQVAGLIQVEVPEPCKRWPRDPTPTKLEALRNPSSSSLTKLTKTKNREREKSLSGARLREKLRNYETSVKRERKKRVL